MTRVLIVEDELIPASYLRRILKKEGYDVVAAVTSGDDAIVTAQTHRPEIILMDIMLEGGVSGTEAAIRIRQFLPEAIVIFLTAYSDAAMVDEALDSGAYAYLVKPYRDDEIITTMKMAKRRCAAAAQQPKRIRLARGYVFDSESMRLQQGEKEVELGPKALGLIALLCRQPNVSISHEQIRRTLWEAPVSGQTLRSLVHRIREATHKHFILNVSKSGYKIALEAEDN